MPPLPPNTSYTYLYLFRTSYTYTNTSPLIIVHLHIINIQQTNKQKKHTNKTTHPSDPLFDDDDKQAMYLGTPFLFPLAALLPEFVFVGMGA